MCYICNRPAHQVFSKTALRLKELEVESPEVLETEIMSTIWIDIPEFASDFTAAEIEYWSKRNFLAELTRFRFRFDLFDSKVETVCDEHREGLKALIEYGWVVPLNKETGLKTSRDLSFFEDLK